MIAYEGKEPYIFVSYSHRDAEKVTQIIRILKEKMCRVWYDEGLKGGDSWNDSIAEHLKACSVFLLFISAASVASKYVFSEINYALTNDKTIIPVVLEKTDIPAGLEMMLSTIQYVDISDKTDIDDTTGSIMSLLPKTVFSKTNMPFLQDLGYSFYMISREVERQETATVNPCTIYYKDSSDNEVELLSFKRLGAYEANYYISSVEPIKDYFYSGKITGSYQVNIKGSFLLEYPLYGPDVDVLLICILRIPRHGVPEMKLVDYQYVDGVSSLNCKDEENLDVIGEKGWSTSIKSYLEDKLYK